MEEHQRQAGNKAWQLPPTAAGNLASVRPSAALAFLAPPPLIAGEDAAAYDDLLARISAALEPSDILEEIWVRDVVDMVWDALRLRRLKAQVLTVSAYEGMHTILRRFLDWQFSEQVARQWALRDQAAVTKAEAVLASAGLTAEAVTAQTLALKIDIVERIDRMMVTAEARQRGPARDRAASRELRAHAAARRAGGRGRRGGRWRRH
jgi:hypothetical protein